MTALPTELVPVLDELLAIQTDTGDAVAALAHIETIVARIDAIEVGIAAAVDQQAVTTTAIGRSVGDGGRLGGHRHRPRRGGPRRGVPRAGGLRHRGG